MEATTVQQTSAPRGRGRGRGYGRGYYQRRPYNNWKDKNEVYQKKEVQSENQSTEKTDPINPSVDQEVPNATKDELKNGNTTESTTQQVSNTKSDESKSNFPKIYCSNLHALVSDAELLQLFQESLPNAKIRRAFIITYGPKSTGRGFVEFENPADALTSLFKLQGFMLRDQPLQLEMERQNRTERQKKRENKPKKPKALPYANELNQVKTKFGEAFKYISENPPVSFSLYFKPSDPDFPYDIERVDLIIEIPEEYPNEPCSFTIKNEDIPERIRNQMKEQVLKRAGIAYKGKPMIMGLLKWLDNNLDKLLVDKVLTQTYQLAQVGIQVLTPQEIKEKLEKETEQHKSEGKEEEIQDHEGSSEESENSEEEEDESEDDEHEESADGQPRGPAYATATAHKGTQLKAESMKIQGIGILQCTQLTMVIACQRCRKQVEINLQPSQTYAVECTNCHQAHIVTFRGDSMHESSAVIGYLDIEGCVPFDIGYSNFNGSCLECSADIPFKKLQFTGIDFLQNCPSCHRKVSIAMERVKFHKIRVERPAPSNIKIVKKPKVRDPKLIGIKAGTPLPDEGACKHYKRSKRWLRFPCCGRVFPCDVCHQEQSQDQHESQWANRMICGFCSREQRVSEGCKFCGLGLVGSNAGHTFWEGGKGCRDNSQLSRKDSHKYKGINKTVSQKSKRVGSKS